MMKITRAAEGLGILLACLALTACGLNREPHILHSYGFGQGTALVTDAKQRVVLTVPSEMARITSQQRIEDPDFGLVGHNEPNQIVCTEPSPDVTQAISDAVKLAVGVDLSKINPTSALVPDGGGNSKTVSADFGQTLTASVAQLGERLASIQLMRDRMYRACEAYANGAINATTYTTMMARHDKAMITLLSSELAAGAFGRELAALGGSAGLKGPNLTDLAAKKKLLDDAMKTLADKQAALDAKVKGLASADVGDGKDPAKAEREAVTAARSDVDTALATYAEVALRNLDMNASSTAQALNGIAGNATRAGGSENVVAIHRNYVDDDGLEVLLEACVAALDYTGPLHSRYIAKFVQSDLKAYRDLIGKAEKGYSDELAQLGKNIDAVNTQINGLDMKAAGADQTLAALIRQRDGYQQQRQSVSNALVTQQAAALSVPAKFKEFHQAALDYRAPMIKFCEQRFAAQFVDQRQSQERALRGTADPLEAAKAQNRRTELMNDCVAKAMELGKSTDQKLKDQAPAVLQACLGQQQFSRAPAAATPSSGEAPQAAPRVPVTRTALNR